MRLRSLGTFGAMAGRAALGLLLLAAGCKGAYQPNGNTPVDDHPVRAHQIRVGLVLDTAGVDDKSFNGGAVAGMQRAQKQLHLTDQDARYVESRDVADYQTNLTNFASQNYDIVFAIGFQMKSALAQVAAAYPNVKFAIVDENAPALPNCAGLLFKEEQGSFLAGYLAGSMSKTGTLGFVGGQRIPLIEKFEAGYRAGAKTANPAIKVVAAYTGNWDDLTGGRNAADQEFSSGADIVFQAAGKGGLGVIEAAKERGAGYYAIGVDQDQDGIAPGRVLTSMVKHVDTAVYDTIERLQARSFIPGDHVYDLKQGGVGLSEMKYTRSAIPAPVLAHLDELTKMVADGKVVPPTTVDAVANFTPPRL